MTDRPPQPVKTYSGARLHEEPRSFYWEGSWRRVKEIRTRWQSPEGLHFKVLAEDGGVFELSYLRREEAWQVRPLGPK